jgi:hypothetical protein
MSSWKPIDTRTTRRTKLGGASFAAGQPVVGSDGQGKGLRPASAIIQLKNLVGNILVIVWLRSVTLYDLTAKSCVVSPRPFQPFDLNSNVPDLLTYNSVLEIVRSVCILLLVCAIRFSTAFVAPPPPPHPLSLSLSPSLSRQDHAKQHPW